MWILFLLGVATSTSAIFEIWNCTSNEFTCRNSKCISKSLMCNDKNDCGDNSDELECDWHMCKEPMFFRCHNGRCITKEFVCNDENDCEDFSDEQNCTSSKLFHVDNSTCEANQWQCNDKFCIPNEWVCNGELDCMDGSDEKIGCNASGIECDGFKCKSGQCIPSEWRCDGAPDCKDKGDEENCNTHVPIENCNLDNRKFLCGDKKTCIDLNHVCDKNKHCPGGSDEGPACRIKHLNCSSHGCSHECFQLPTGPKCVCPMGYKTIDDKHCQDMNECEQFGVCDQKCRNSRGSYHCYCDHGYTLSSDKRTCKVSSGEAIMVFSSRTDIRGYMLESNVYFSMVGNLTQAIGVHYDGHHVYWSNIYLGQESIVRSLKDGSKMEYLTSDTSEVQWSQLTTFTSFGSWGNLLDQLFLPTTISFQNLVYLGLGSPEDLTVDWLTGNIYFTDAEYQHIGVCSGDGTHCTVLINKDVKRPRGIVLNVLEGDMYWTDWQKPSKIAYALMDGTNDRSFVSDDIYWPNSLGLDLPNGRLYWSDSKKMTLESINLDGTGRRVILDGILRHPYGVAVFESTLYWSDWYTNSVESCNKFTGKERRTVAKEKLVYGLSIFHSSFHQKKANPCSTALCSDMCLLKGKGGYSCACPQNKALGADKHICRDIESKRELVVGFKNVLARIQHPILGRHVITVVPSTVKEIGALTYDSSHNSLLISDLSTRKIVSLNMDTKIESVLDISGLEKVTAMDYDPTGNNLYLYDQRRTVLEVVNLNTLARKILLQSDKAESITSIALVPSEGVMFVAFKRVDKDSSHLDRLNMDGTGRTHLTDSGLVGPISLHYESYLHRVYVGDHGYARITFMDSEGQNKYLFRTLKTNPATLTSLDNLLFWMDSYSKYLYWTEKLSDTVYNKKVMLELAEEPEFPHIVALIPTPPGVVPVACNCSHLCLASRKSRVCACPSGWTLSDNFTCTRQARCASGEIPCAQSNTSGKAKTDDAHGKMNVVHSVPITDDDGISSGTIVICILVPLTAFLLACTFYLLRRRNKGGFNYRVRFYNPLSKKKVSSEEMTDEYEYSVHFEHDECNPTVLN